MDYSDYVGGPPADSVLKQLSNYVGTWRELTAERDEVEARLKELNAEIKQIVERDIPNLMDTNGCESLETTDGLKVSVKETIHASIPKAMRPEAHKWLEEHSHGDIIKTKLLTEFGRGEMDKAREAAKRLEAFTDKPALIDESVHPQTLSALVRELLREGHDVPQDLLGVARVRKANIV